MNNGVKAAFLLRCSAKNAAHYVAAVHVRRDNLQPLSCNTTTGYHDSVKRVRQFGSLALLFPLKTKNHLS